ncbi:MAG: rod shape-determining protein MreC [Candidatus Kerfeldbacteria bacterium]|nr:rod shape-determining protein MreC [Candidatus Kerfeldbacteria bacterium]
MTFWKHHWLRLIIVGVVLLGGITLLRNTISRTIVQPLAGFFYEQGNQWWPWHATTTDQLHTENQQLKTQLATAVGEISNLELQLQHYQEYEVQLKFAEQNELTLVPARIIGRVGQSTTTQILNLNQGSEAGIAVGDPVIYAAGIVIGLVHSVDATSATVLPITSPLVKLQAVTQTNQQSTGLISGAFGTSLTMDYILKDQTVAIGDIVITNGHDTAIPPGLLIGTVASIATDTSDLFTTAQLSPYLPYTSDSIVSVIVSNL